MKKENGFTLTELMIVLAIAAILLTIGVPAFQTMLHNNRTLTETSNMIAAFNFARSEAIRTKASVTICSSANADVAAATCAGNANWETGWIIFADTNSDGSRAAGETLLKTGQGLNAATVTGSMNFLRYTLNGYPNSIATMTLTGDTCEGNNQHVISIALTGRISSARNNCP